MPCNDSKAQQEEDSSFFLAMIQPIKDHRLLVDYSPDNLLFLSLRVLLRVLLLLHWGSFQQRLARVQFSSVQALSHVQLFATPWTAAHQASLSITISRSSLKLMSIELVMPSSHLILCRPLLLLPPIPPSVRIFSSESTLCMRWPKYWSFSFNIIPSKETQGWSPSEWTG